MTDFTWFKFPEWRTVLSGTAVFTAGFLIRGFFVSPPVAGIIRSPLTTLVPKLSEDQLKKLPYPLDSLPGARDVDSPFGSIRVYEFGPDDGPKVLLLHGISTPCLALGGVANALVERGCRVMLFDLPGRGYSDTPSDLEHDLRLFSAQIFTVLASSPLSWTGSASAKFSLIGYSLGGGIAAGFMSYFPHLIKSLVLIAPAGLIRDHHISRSSRILYSRGVIPEPILHRMVRKRLQKPMYPPEDKSKMEERAGVKAAVQAEIKIEHNSTAILSKKHPDFSIEDAVVHQVINHQGFVHAFMSSIRHGPIQRQHGDWSRIGGFLEQQKQQNSTAQKVLIILGEDDPIIKVDEIQPDAREVLKNNVEFRVMAAGHEVPVTKADEVVEFIWDFWQAQKDSI